jgi:hypothetical protein
VNLFFFNSPASFGEIVIVQCSIHLSSADAPSARHFFKKSRSCPFERAERRFEVFQGEHAGEQKTGPNKTSVAFLTHT